MRMYQHKQGKTRSTKKYKSIKLFYTEEFPSYAEARNREKALKNNFGKQYLKEKLKNAGIV